MRKNSAKVSSLPQKSTPLELEKSAEDIDWENERNVKIQLAQESDFVEMKHFLNENFYDDEPISKSLQGHNIEGYFGRKLHEYTEQFMIGDPLKSQSTRPACIVVRSNETGKILAARFGDIKKRHEVKEEPSVAWLSNLPACIPIPAAFLCAGNYDYLLESLPYHPNKAFDELKCETVYSGTHLCVGRDSRGKGFGEKLIKLSHRLAENAGCDFTYIMASGKYSQAIFKKLGYKVIHERNYADFEQDRKGRPFLNDHGEHSVIQVVIYEHQKK